MTMTGVSNAGGYDRRGTVSTIYNITGCYNLLEMRGKDKQAQGSLNGAVGDKECADVIPRRIVGRTAVSKLCERTPGGLRWSSPCWGAPGRRGSLWII